MHMVSPSDGSVAQSLNLKLSFYQNGIARMLIGEAGVDRFRISQEDLPVVEEQLIAAEDLEATWSDDGKSLTISGLKSDAGDEEFEYVIEFDRFRVKQNTINGDQKITTMVVNNEDTLYYETEAAAGRPQMYGHE